LEISGDVVLITGAAGNLGCALSRVFARAGCKVAGLDISAPRLERFSAAVAEVGGESLALACDLRDWEASRRAVDEAAHVFGGVDILVNNATARTNPVLKPLHECTAEEMTLVAEVGPHAALGMMRAALPYLKKRPGTVINLGSGAGLEPTGGMAPYAMSKGAMHTLTRAAAREWGQHGITVNAVLPIVMTEQLARTIQDNPEKIPMPPIGRYGDPERDLGPVVQFLASRAASYVTGQCLPVDGGMDMMR